MPIKEKNDSGLAVGIPFNQTDNLATKPVEATPSTPSALEVADAALRKENYVTRFVYGERNPYAGEIPNKEFDALGNIHGYEDYAKWFSEANSDKEVEWIKRQVDQDRGYSDTLKRAGGWGTAASIAAGLITPDVAIGGGVVGKAFKGGKYAKAAIEGAELGLVSGTLYGAGQNVGNPSRGTLDVIEDAGVFTLAGALLAPAFHGAGKLIRGRAAETIPPVAEHAADEAAIHTTASGFKQYAEHVKASPASASDADAERLTSEIAAANSQAAQPQVIVGRNPPTPSQPYVAPNMGDMDLVGAFGAQKIGLGQSAVALANSRFIEAKIAAQKLFRDLRWRKGNIDGTYTTLQSVESEFERLGRAASGQGLEHQQQAWKEYINGGWESPQSLQYVQQAYGKNKLSFKEFDDEIGHAMSNADRHAIREIERVAQHGRTLIDSLAGEASRLGLLDTSGNLKGTALSYFGRSYNVDKIVAEQQAFRRLLANEFQRTNPAWTQDQLQEAAQKVYEHIVNGSSATLTNIRTLHIDTNGNIIPLGSRTKSSVAMERVLEIDDNVLEPYLDKSYGKFIKRYGNTVGKDIALTKMIGDTTGDKLMDALRAERMAEAAKIEAMTISPEEKAKLFNQLQDDFETTKYHLNNGVSLLNGTYKLSSNPHMWATDAAQALTTYNYITKMGSAALSSLTDPVKNILTFGLLPTLKHTVPGIRQAVGDIFRLPAIKDKAFDAMVQANKRIGIGLETALHTRNIYINDLIENSSSRRGPINKGLDYLGDKMGRLNLLDNLTDIQKQMTGVLANDEIIRSVIAETAGTASKRELANLRRFGINTDMARRIADEFNIGLAQGQNSINGGIYLTSTSRWADREAAETLERTLSAVTHSVVYNPSAGAKVVIPTGFFGKDMESVMTQFLSFNLGSHIQHFTPMLQKFDLATFNYMVSSVIMGAVVWEIKNSVKQLGSDKDEKDRTAKEQIYDAVSEAGIAPMPFLLNNLTSGVSRQFDMRRHLTDDDRPTLGATNFNTGAPIGPAGQVMANALNIGTDIYNDTVDRGTISSARQMLPFQNLFYLRWLFNMGEQQAQEFLDVPDKAITTITIKK